MTSALPSLSAARTAWRQVRTRVARHVDYGAGHRWLDLAVPPGFAAPAPGQFVQLLLGPHASAALLPRPMSVAGVRLRTDARGLVLGFLYVPVGVGTRALAALPVGAEVECLGPLGCGYPVAVPGTPVLVAGGRGVAPLIFMADALAKRHGPGPRAARRGPACEFLFGARSKAQLVGLDDARRRLARLGGRLHLCTDDGSRGSQGTVVRLLERLAPSIPRPIVIHACGPHAMLRAVARWALAHRVPAYLATESVMACGTGVCRGCPLARSAAGREAFDDALPSLLGSREYAMCCTEGPVFEASQLDWDRIE